MTSGGSFHWLDYVIFCLLLLMSCGVGVYHASASKKQSQADYLMGNRKMNWLAVAMSLMVSFNSSTATLGKPAEVYYFGIQHSIRLIGIAMSIVIALYTFVPLLYNLKLTSSYEVSQLT